MKDKNCFNYMEGREAEFESIVKIINEGIDSFEKRVEKGSSRSLDYIAVLKTILLNISGHKECLNTDRICEQEDSKCAEIKWELRHNRYTKYKSTLLKRK